MSVRCRHICAPCSTIAKPDQAQHVAPLGQTKGRWYASVSMQASPHQRPASAKDTPSIVRCVMRRQEGLRVLPPGSHTTSAG